MNSPYRSCENFELIDLSNDNNLQVNIPQNKEHSINLTDLINNSKFFFEILLHIFIHISMLSYLETLFYFFYITKIEKKALLDQMKSLSRIGFNYVNNENIINLFFNNYHDQYIDSFYNSIYLDAKNQNNYNQKINEELFEKSLIFSIILSSISIFYYFCFQLYFKEKKFIYKLLVKHVFMIFFIGLYEYWFFLNIVINYRFLTSQELSYYIFSCFWYNTKLTYPQLKQFENTTDIQCTYNL